MISIAYSTGADGRVKRYEAVVCRPEQSRTHTINYAHNGNKSVEKNISIDIPMDALQRKARSLGATELGVSSRQGKRYYVIYQNKTIHFGSKDGSTFIDHHDRQIRNAWIARHSKVKNRAGQYVMTLSPAYWAINLLAFFLLINIEISSTS